MLVKRFNDMKKRKFNYSDFSKAELESLKEYYITEKIKSMKESELRKFVYENISHQIKNTIGDEEEQEAWDEIQTFFSDNFEETVELIKKKFEATNQNWDNEPKKNSADIKVQDIEASKNEKIDMWKD